MIAYDPSEPLDMERWRQAIRDADGAELAAATRWGVPALVAEVERLRAENARLGDALTRAENEVEALRPWP